MPHRAVTLCKPCLNKKYPLRRQLLLSFLSLAAVSLLLALAVVILTTSYIGDKAEEEARKSLRDQIERHLQDASVEAASTIGERFRKLQYGVLDVTAFALRDALQENLILDGGGEGYPLSPAHTDLRDTEITASAEANLVTFSRQNIEVDLGRSVWYYADATSYTADVPATDVPTIENSARLDLLWPTMYANSNDTKAIIVAVELDAGRQPGFRYFPGNDLSSVSDSLFACNFEDEPGCYDPSARSWYTLAVDADVSDEIGLGKVVVTGPYIDAIGSEKNWLVTVSRAVYGDAGAVEGRLLGVVGVDVRLEQVQLSVESINFLDSGYSILATAADEGEVLAAPARVWDRDAAEEATTVCALGNGICSGDEWEGLLAEAVNGVYEFTSTGGGGDGSSSSDAEPSILVAAPVQVVFDTETNEGTTTHYILSAVPSEEIYRPASGMGELIASSAEEIMLTTAFVAIATLLAVAAAVYFLSGSITRPIAKMTSAARSIARDGAKTDVFGGVAAAWGGGREGGSSMDGTTAGAGSRGTRVIDYLLCRGEDEINTLAREFSLMITGLGKRGLAAESTELEGTSVYPLNPFTSEFGRAPATAPAAPSAPPRS